MRAISRLSALLLVSLIGPANALAEAPAAAPVDDEPTSGAPAGAVRAPAPAPASAGQQAAPAPADLVPVGITTTSTRLRYATLGFQSCRLPCTVFVPPGVQPLLVTGEAQLLTHVEVGRAPTMIRLKDWTRFMRILGGSMLGGGALIGSTLWAVATTRSCSRDNGCVVANATWWPMMGFVTMMSGAGILGYAANHPSPEAIVEVPGATRSERPRLIGLGIAPSESGATAAAAFAF